MKRLIALLLLPLCLAASGEVGLRTLITHAQSHNGDILAKDALILSSQKAKEAEQSSYWPTVDIGASYSRVNPSTIVSPRDTATGFVSVGVDLYDGGRREALIDAKSSELTRATYEKEALGKGITLRIIRNYYTEKTLEAMLQALYGEAKELKAQLRRIRKFVKEGLATQEQADKLEAAYAAIRYRIENTKFNIETARQNLSLLSGLPVKKLASQRIREPLHIGFSPDEKSRILESSAQSIEANACALEAGYGPHVRLEDTYSRSHFSKTQGLPGFDTDTFLPDHQNKLSLSVHMRLYDHGRIAKESEALRYKKLALQSQYTQSIKAQKMRYHLAQKRLKTLRAKLQSASTSLKAAKSTYRAIRKKFEAGLVDDITYLDALNKMTLARARYKETHYEYEIAKAELYYSAGRDPKEYIR